MEKMIKLEEICRDLLGNKETSHGLRRALRRLMKEVRLYKYHILGRKERQKLGKVIIPDNIQIGGGSHVLPGFLNIDIIPPGDMLCDVREGIPLEDISCRFIFSEHFFEHLDYPISAKKFIGECFRILKPGGSIVLGVPDSEVAVAAYHRRDLDFYEKAMNTWYSKRSIVKDVNTYIDLLNYHFRDQDDDEKYNPHLWAYDFEKLSSLLTEAGFKSTAHWEFNSQIASPKRQYGSIYIEAVK